MPTTSSPQSSAPGRKAILAVLAALFIVTVPAMIASSQKPNRAAPAAQVRKTITPTIPDANRYQSDKVFLEHADLLHYEQQPESDVQYQVLNGNVRFRRADMFMYCDSAYFYEGTNSFDAFGNVRMEQGDTLFVYADELNYDGQSELAILFADAGKKVRLINRDVKLETDIFNYDMAAEVGFYEVGGRLTDAQNELESWEGQYHPNTKFAYFYRDVHLTSLNRNDTLNIYTDSLIYNTDTHIARLISPTKIVNSDGVIDSSSGTYNTETGVADLFRRSMIKTNRGNTLTGDTLFYDREKQYGEAFGNMILTDSARQASLHGNYGYYNDLADSAFVTGRALAKEYSKGDTLYMHGDTINAYVDRSDSTRITNVFHKVRIYRVDLQGICDSLSVTESDSLMRMFRHPIIWSGNRQIFGNIITAHFNDSTVDWARLPQTGFMAEHIAEDCYNQLSGTDMTAWFNDSTVRRLYVEGNVELIIFPAEKDSTYNKFAQVESSFMDAWFLNNQVERISFWPETTSKMVPLYLAKRNQYFLQKFRWYGTLRPSSPEDVFVISDEMIELMNSADPLPPSLKRRKTKNDAAPNAAAPPVPAPVPEATLPDSIPPVDNPALPDSLPQPVPEPITGPADEPEAQQS